MDDVHLNFEPADEIFDCSKGASRYPHEDGGIERLLLDKNIPVKKSSSFIDISIEVTDYLANLCYHSPL